MRFSRLYTSSARRKLSSLSPTYIFYSVHEPKMRSICGLCGNKKLCCTYYYVIFSHSLSLFWFFFSFLFMLTASRWPSSLSRLMKIKKKMHQQSCALRNNIQIYEKCNKRSFENSSARLWVIMKFYHLPSMDGFWRQWWW